MTLIPCPFFQQFSQKMQIEFLTNAEKYWICNRNKFIQKWHGKWKQWKVMQKCTKNTANGHWCLIQVITNAIQPLIWRPYIWTNCRELSSVKLYIYTKKCCKKSNKFCFHSCALPCTCQSCHMGSHCYANNCAFKRKGCYTYIALWPLVTWLANARGERPSGLRRCNKNRKVPGSKTARRSAGLRDPTSLRGSL